MNLRRAPRISPTPWLSNSRSSSKGWSRLPPRPSHPSSQSPSRARRCCRRVSILPKGVYLAGGVLFGLILGVAAAVLRELLDTRVRDDGATEALAGAPVLAKIPRDSGAKRRPLVVVDDPDSPRPRPTAGCEPTYASLRSTVVGDLCS